VGSVRFVSREAACFCDFPAGYRLNGVQEVGGSNPLAPILAEGTFIEMMNVPFFFLPLHPFFAGRGLARLTQRQARSARDAALKARAPAAIPFQNARRVWRSSARCGLRLACLGRWDLRIERYDTNLPRCFGPTRARASTREVIAAEIQRQSDAR